MYRRIFYQVCTSSRHHSTLHNNVCKVCIVGAGPAGFYAALQLAKKLKDVQIDIIEKLPVPFGLVRYGVAPDHPDVKNVINTFTKIAHRPNVNFYGNISIGKDIRLRELREFYHAVVLAYGAEHDKILGIPNEDNRNVIAARKFVGWYNGVPDDVDLQVDLSCETAAVLGQGNVAMDVARILLTSPDILRKTDITQHAMDCIAESKVKTVYLVGRRGPLQAAFTTKELREQIKMDGCVSLWRNEDFKGVEELLPNLQRPRKRLTELMLQSLQDQDDKIGEKYFRPIFKRSPNKFIADGDKLSAIELTVNTLEGADPINVKCKATSETELLNCGIAFRSIGYKSLKVDEDINFDERKGNVVNNQGRVLDSNGDIDQGLYVVGWLRTGPAGVLLDTMANAFKVAANVIEDVSKNEGDFRGKRVVGFDGVSELLKGRNIEIVDWEGWERIDEYEQECGKKVGKPREKICSVKKMLEVAL